MSGVLDGPARSRVEGMSVLGMASVAVAGFGEKVLGVLWAALPVGTKKLILLTASATLSINYAGGTASSSPIVTADVAIEVPIRYAEAVDVTIFQVGGATVLHVIALG